MVYLIYLLSIAGIVFSAAMESLLSAFFCLAIMICSVSFMIQQRLKRTPFTWQPWIWSQTCDLTRLNLKPPCEHCVHWKPTTTNTYPPNARLCHTPGDMERDFSCFDTKEA